ncbi:hypothetical protein C8F04DRAFT_1189009 [Mycena alexandri]|uniref:Uncharacterized protein n=1 Tax=Mycena alexandri TaxID=1745969 RepID=A0AAD6WYE6_9AGAR|nr:hypothetical protein C8F04DRAFT_1189009 [Mycena alexandri]
MPSDTTARPSRAVKGNAKAKTAAQIAQAESKEAESDTPIKRKRGRPKKKLTPDELTGSGSDDGVVIPKVPVKVKTEAEVEAVEIEAPFSWSGDAALTWTLVTAIEGDDAIRRGLFPPPGSSKRTGGLPKKHFHWQLANTCFAEHPAYEQAFKRAVKPKQQDVWTGKIKNRLGIIKDKVKAAMDLMGQTGAGLESVGDIQEGTELMTKWDEIKLDSPWFWEMRSLIGERPNLRPVGIGNNNSAMDVSLLLPGSDDDTARTSSPDLFPETLAGMDMDSDDESTLAKQPIEVDDDSDVEGVKAKTGGSAKPPKRRAVSEPASPNVKPPTKKTKPQPAVSVPTTSTAKLAKPATTKDKFTATILAEEETRRRELALTKDKNRARAEIELAKVKSLRDVKVEKTKMKAKEKLAKIELARLKMEQDHQFRMAQFVPWTVVPRRVQYG